MVPGASLRSDMASPDRTINFSLHNIYIEAKIMVSGKIEKIMNCLSSADFRRLLATRR